ncbi:hypothetical protein CPB85DRAFT_753724 [Mucidula mucida]|nr:hypothetical protein CPB85DRAFT_753724 [Mucidula mucida]
MIRQFSIRIFYNVSTCAHAHLLFPKYEIMVPKSSRCISASCLQRCPQRSSTAVPKLPVFCPTLKIVRHCMAHRCDYCQSTCFGYRTSEPQPPPDIARLLATNDPPSSSEDEEFRQIRHDGAKHLSDLDETIGEMREALEGLMIEREALAWKVQNCGLVLNPVRRLPADILHEIFLFACERSAKNPSHYYIVAPTILTSVCRSWNHIAATDPQLWRQCTLSLTCPSNRRSGVRNFTHVSQEYLRCLSRVTGVSMAITRSATSPLWVNVYLDNSFSDSSPAFPLLLSLASRIQRLRINTSDLACLNLHEFRHFVNYLTMLESMDLCSMSNNIVFDAISLPHAPKHLSITPYKTYSKPTIDLGWSYLDSLELRARYLGQHLTSVQSTLHILSRARNIRLLTFAEDWDNEDLHASFQDDGIELGPTPGQYLTMVSLTDLIVETPTIDDVLAKLRTPSLE